MAKFSDYTNILVQKLPYWFKMKKDPYNSIGPAFLNAFGLELEDVRYILEYAYNQTRIEDADVNYLDRAYKIVLPGNIDIEDIKSVSTNHFVLDRVYDLITFFDITYDIPNREHAYNQNIYFYDKKRHSIFIKQQYDVCNHFPNGKLTVHTSEEHIEFHVKHHKVWNFFDEFGLLLDCYRLEGETNLNYKKRLLDVFTNIGGSNRDGLLNALARELNIRENVIWKDCSKDLVLKDQMIVANKIQVEGSYLPLDDIFINEYNQIVLKGDYELVGVSKKVTYVHGIEMHEMCNKDDKKTNYEFFYSDKKPKKVLIDYVRKMHDDMPIIWGKFRWDSAYWDVNDEQIGGLAFIPSFYDASIKGFEKYKSKGE